MPKFKISNDYISKCNDTDVPQYPKYTTQVINLANQNAGGTRPRNVGQLSELFLSICHYRVKPLFLVGENGIPRDIRMLSKMQLTRFGHKLITSEIVWIILTSLWLKLG